MVIPGKVLNDVNLEVCRSECVGIVGTTGSGKSTLVDLLMGLLRPTNGKVLVDDLDVWSTFTHQHIQHGVHLSHMYHRVYILQIALLPNIAFGIPMCDIDMDK